MTVNNIGKSFSDGTIRGHYPFQNRNSQRFEERLLPGKAAGKQEENKTAERTTNREQPTAYGKDMGQYMEEIAAASARIWMEHSRDGTDAVRECEVRHLTYADSDFSKVYAAEGFSLKAKADLEEGKVYLEQKFEDGTLKAYEVDAEKLEKETGGILEQTAVKVWEKAKEMRQDTAVDFHTAMLVFYERVKEQIKNGPPKFQTGGAAFSEDEWKKLIEKLDSYLEEVREELKVRSEEREKEDEVSSELIEKLLEDRAVSEITLQWSGGAIYAEEKPDGQSFSVYKAEGYTKEQPFLTIKGTDKEGREYEQHVNALEIDPCNASYAKIMALNAYLVETELLESTDMPQLDWLSEDYQEKTDYISALRKYRETQMSLGNMAGYQKAVKVCEAFINFWDEHTGNITVMDAPGMEEVRVYRSENWSLQSPILGITTLHGAGGWDSRHVQASYAENSTAEDPVVRVSIMKEGDAKGDEYFIHINEIDPQNATQMEMFALCSHLERQGLSGTQYFGEGYSNLLSYASNAGYDAGISEFVTEKKNWTAILSDNKANELTEKYPAYIGWRELFLELLEQYLKNRQEQMAEKQKEKAEEKNPAEDMDKTAEADEAGKTSSRMIERADGSKVLEIIKVSAGTEFKMYMETEKGKDA